MSKKAKIEYLLEIKSRYQKANKEEKQNILNEFCKVCGYNRKYAIHLLNQKQKKKNNKKNRAGRKKSYNNPIIIHFLNDIAQGNKLDLFEKIKTNYSTMAVLL